MRFLLMLLIFIVLLIIIIPGLFSKLLFLLPFRTRKQIAFFNATFETMGHIAKADGRVTEQDIATANRVMQATGLGQTLREKAIARFNIGKQGDFNLEKTLNKLMNYCYCDETMLRIFIDIQYQVVKAGNPSAKKQQILDFICQKCGVEPSAYQRDHEQNALADPYQTLGLTSAASNDAVKTAYRRLMSQHHPDKLMARGLPKEMLAAATAKTQFIQRAYELIKKQRGL